ncbi:MAG: hypothetical protein ABI867_26190 [Kofleriaceae bacterium]
MKLIGIVLAVVLASGSAYAGDKVILEVFTGGKPSTAATQLSPLTEALANRGFIGGDQLARKFEPRVSRPALEPKGLPADFAAQIDAGSAAWSAGQFDDAVRILGKIVDAAHRNPGAFVNQPQKQQLLAKALVALALSQQRRGDPSAVRSAFGEYLRTFRGDTISRATYGPDAVKAFEQARGELSTNGLGKLELRANADTAVFYINERIVGTGPLKTEDLVPGDYRVIAQIGKQLTRSHIVSVKANETATLAIDIGFDIAVQTSPTWTGLAFSTAADRERSETGHAARFGSELAADAVAIIGIEEVRGKAAIIGALVNKSTGGEMRRGSVAMSPPPTDAMLEALAQYISGESPSVPPGVHEETPRTGTIGTTTTGTPADVRIVKPIEDPPAVTLVGGRWGGWKYLSGGVAIAAFGVGAVTLSYDGKCKEEVQVGMQCANLYNTKLPGFLAIGGGTVLAAVTVYLIATGNRHPSKTAFIAPTGDGAMAGLTGRF